MRYRKLDDRVNQGSLAAELAAAVKELQPLRLIVVEPGEWRVRDMLVRTAKQLKVELEIRTDRHFLCSPEEFADHARGRKQLRLEYFYRELRRKHEILMGGQSTAGRQVEL